MVHKLSRHRYLEADGRDHLESRGFHTGPPTHYETLCGKQFEHHYTTKKSMNRSPKNAVYRWTKVDCIECLVIR